MRINAYIYFHFHEMHYFLSLWHTHCTVCVCFSQFVQWNPFTWRTSVWKRDLLGFFVLLNTTTNWLRNRIKTTWFMQRAIMFGFKHLSIKWFTEYDKKKYISHDRWCTQFKRVMIIIRCCCQSFIICDLISVWIVYIWLESYINSLFKSTNNRKIIKEMDKRTTSANIHTNSQTLTQKIHVSSKFQLVEENNQQLWQCTD